MKFEEIYRLAIAEGIKADPREKSEIDRILADVAKKFKKLDAKDRQIFDREKLTNPYSDTRILFGNTGKEVKKIAIGIDIEVGEVLLIDRLNQKGAGIDAIIAHHPEGKALLALADVMHLQEDTLSKLGVPINIAEGVLSDRISEVSRGIAPINAERAVDAARLLDIPLMCLHTVADNQVQKFLEDLMRKKSPRTVGDILDILREIPEYKNATLLNAGPRIFAGKESARAGRIAVDMTGGTEGSEKVYEKLSHAGVGTIIGMHMSDKLKNEAEKHHINIVIAGHISSDSLGLNILFDKILGDKVEIVPLSGYFRYPRAK